MHLPDFLPYNPPALSDRLRRRVNELRSKIVKANYNTQFVKTAPELIEFRNITNGHVDGMDDDNLFEAFCNTIQFTTYSSYQDLIAKFSKDTWKATAIADLFAPGLPDCLCVSSSTSGGYAKIFPKYNTFSTMRSCVAGPFERSDLLRKRTKAYVYYLAGDEEEIVDDNNSRVGTIQLIAGSAAKARMELSLNFEEDAERMGTFVLDHAAPYATGFIEKWRSFLLIHALFTVSSRFIETMNMVFINAFVDMMHHLDTEFDMIVDSIANGTIPDLEGIADVRQYLEMNFSPDPERAAELRRIGRPSSLPGWCAYVWPNLRSVRAIASGPFSVSVPFVRRLLGSNAHIHSYGYGSSEAWIGSPYNPLQLNQFKIDDESVFELLDVTKDDSISALAQLWEAEAGRRYELVLTTTDGLWRYRLGDVVEICGFDPTDGLPIIQFVERRNVAIRFPNLMISEKDLRAAMTCVAADILVNWTSAMDDRRAPSTIGFFVELAAGHDPDLTLAPGRMLDELLNSNVNIICNMGLDKFRKPTISLVRPGTFSEFLQLKLDEGSNNVGQIKIPVSLPKPEYVAWFLERVVKEL